MYSYFFYMPACSIFESQHVNMTNPQLEQQNLYALQLLFIITKYTRNNDLDTQIENRTPSNFCPCLLPLPSSAHVTHMPAHTAPTMYMQITLNVHMQEEDQLAPLRYSRQQSICLANQLFLPSMNSQTQASLSAIAGLVCGQDRVLSLQYSSRSSEQSGWAWKAGSVRMVEVQKGWVACKELPWLVGSVKM